MSCTETAPEPHWNSKLYNFPALSCHLYLSLSILNQRVHLMITAYLLPPILPTCAKSIHLNPPNPPNLLANRSEGTIKDKSIIIYTNQQRKPKNFEMVGEGEGRAWNRVNLHITYALYSIECLTEPLVARVRFGSFSFYVVFLPYLLLVSRLVSRVSCSFELIHSFLLLFFQCLPLMFSLELKLPLIRKCVCRSVWLSFWEKKNNNNSNAI